MITKEQLQEVIDTLGLIGLHANDNGELFRMADWKLSAISEEARMLLVNMQGRL